jgi:hypothetical protein
MSCRKLRSATYPPPVAETRFFYENQGRFFVLDARVRDDFRNTRVNCWPDTLRAGPHQEKDTTNTIQPKRATAASDWHPGGGHGWVWHPESITN